MREAKRRLDAVLRRRESLVNVEGSSPASITGTDDSFSDAGQLAPPTYDAARQHTPERRRLRRRRRALRPREKGTPSRVGTRHDGFDPRDAVGRLSGHRPLRGRRARVGGARALRRVRRAGDSGVRRRRRGGKRRQEGAVPWRRGSPAARAVTATPGSMDLCHRLCAKEKC